MIEFASKMLSIAAVGNSYLNGRLQVVFTELLCYIDPAFDSASFLHFFSCWLSYEEKFLNEVVRDKALRDIIWSRISQDLRWSIDIQNLAYTLKKIFEKYCYCMGFLRLKYKKTSILTSLYPTSRNYLFQQRDKILGYSSVQWETCRM